MCRQFIVTGRVQGVFFRASTRDIAKSLNLSGHAVNLADGSVEVLACGDGEGVAALEQWLHLGPPQSVVSRVTESPVNCRHPAGFKTG